MAKGKTKISSRSDSAPPPARSLRSRKREAESNDVGQTANVQAPLHLKGVEEVTTAAKPLQECAVIVHQLCQSVEQSCLTRPDEATKEKPTDESEVSFLSTAAPKSSSSCNENQAESWAGEDAIDDDSKRQQATAVVEIHRSTEQMFTDPLQDSEVSEASSTSVEKEVEGQQEQQESAPAFPAKKRRRMGSCGLTEGERSRILGNSEKKPSRVKDNEMKVCYDPVASDTPLRSSSYESGKKQAEPQQAELQQQEELQQAELKQAELQQAELQQVELKKAELQQAELQQQEELQQAELKQAELQQAELQQAELKHAELEQAEVQQAELQQAELQEAELKQAEKQQVELQQAELQQAELKQTEVQQAELLQAELLQAELKHAELEQAEVQQAGLQQAELQQAELKKAELQQAELKKAELQQAELQQQEELQQAELKKAELQHADENRRAPTEPPISSLYRADPDSESAPQSTQREHSEGPEENIRLDGEEDAPPQTVNAEERTSSTEAPTTGHRCGSVEPPTEIPADSEETCNGGSTDAPAAALGSGRDSHSTHGCSDDVSDSQLNTIVFTEELMEDQYCLEDASELLCGIISELSSINRRVMAAHRELEKLRRSRKASRYSAH
ncbi:involucrin isoform X2 [Oryzias melastigma]|uniref:involucrin isoform X2 n=1 Tax=Oryzias melastigma TaxID=30732 RepID=UPI000CF7C73B|nr:involucrin isoform X2 [Oryzias melastigma]XP_024115163.1 involucrin isoform X2 [Oryzias melastigma]